MSGDGLDGIISVRDIIAAFSRFGKSTVDKIAADIMTTSVITCPVSTDSTDVLALMSQHRIRHVPITSEGQVVGLLSVRDILDIQQHMLVADIARREEDEAALSDSLANLKRPSTGERMNFALLGISR